MRLEEIRKRLRGKVVGIAGCGGLGSNAAIALARVGIGKLIIADFDKVEEGNLSRQYFFSDQIGLCKVAALKENVRRVNASVIVDAHAVELTPKLIVDLFSGCDVILEAFDTAEAKTMIIECVQSFMPEKLLIAGVGVAGWGKNELLKEVGSGSLHIIGDQANETSDENPPLAPRVGAVANMMANSALEFLLRGDEDGETVPQ